MRYIELVDILLEEEPSVKLRERKDELGLLIPEFKKCFDFDQKNVWHPYDVFEHTLRVIDGVSYNNSNNNDLCLRLAALFHDVGKPYIKDSRGPGHFFGHWDKSKEIFIKYKDNFYLGFSSFGLICDLIEYHDLDISKENIDIFMKTFSEEEMDMLFILKKSDILAQNEEFIMERLDSLEKQKDLYYSTLDECSNKQFLKGKDDYQWTD
jgi:tRNA nucleotidyltransferase (CCA-adding enzyme)